MKRSSCKWQLFWNILMELKFSRQCFEKNLNIKFHHNASSGSRVVACGRTDMTKLVVSSRTFEKAPKKSYKHNYPCTLTRHVFVIVTGRQHLQFGYAAGSVIFVSSSLQPKAQKWVPPARTALQNYIHRVEGQGGVKRPLQFSKG